MDGARVECVLKPVSDARRMDIDEPETAAEAEVVVVHDEAGEERWLPLAEARRWDGRTEAHAGERLYRAAERWVQVYGSGTAVPIDDRSALRWLLGNGYLPPSELAELAEHSRLK